MRKPPHRPQPCPKFDSGAGTGSMDLTAFKIYRRKGAVKKKKNGGLLSRRSLFRRFLDLIAPHGFLKPLARLGLNLVRIIRRGRRRSIAVRLRLLLLNRTGRFVAFLYEGAAIFCRHCRSLSVAISSEKSRSPEARKSKRALALFARRVLDPSLCRDFRQRLGAMKSPSGEGLFCRLFEN